MKSESSLVEYSSLFREASTVTLPVYIIVEIIIQSFCNVIFFLFCFYDKARFSIFHRGANVNSPGIAGYS